MIGDHRTITEVLFSRKREVEGWPTLHGGQEIAYPARRNTRGVGYLSAMFCKSCVVALKGDVLTIERLEKPGIVAVSSRSQSGGREHLSILGEDTIWLLRGQVTYHLGLLLLAEALIKKERAHDVLNALEEILTYRETNDAVSTPAYDRLLLHLCDELYYWAKWQDNDPVRSRERLDSFTVNDVVTPPAFPVVEEIAPETLTTLPVLQAYRTGTLVVVSKPVFASHRFRGPQLDELVESLGLGMHCLLAGPTATGKSLCATEAFGLAAKERTVFVIEGHESLREFDLLGGYTPEGGGTFFWQDGILVQAMKAGGFLFIDEANRMPTRTLNVLLGILSRGVVILTEHGSEEVTADAGFQVVIAMNLGQGYAVNTLDRALLDRFPCVLEFRYLPPGEEEDLLMEKTRIDRDTARIMVKVAGETRRLHKCRELAGELTPRGLFSWAKKFLVKKGTILTRLQASARTTWLHQVAGTDADGYLREDTAQLLLSLIEAHTPK